MKKAVLAGAAVLAFGSTAFAQTTTYNDTLDIAFVPGTGISNQNFAITRYTIPNLFGGEGNDIELGLKSKERFFGIDNVGVSDLNNRYYVQPGFSPVSGADPTPSTNAWWNFDFSIDLGARTLADTNVTLEIDFDGDSLGPVSFNLGDAYDNSLSVIQGSQNVAFAYLGFDPNARGTYTFKLEAAFPGVPTPFAGITMQTVVVPLPGAAGMALAGMGLIGLRRRR